MSNKIRVLIVEDHFITRVGLTMVLNEWPTMEVIGEADNGVEALQKIEELKPDVALIDIGLPQMDGIECATTLNSRSSNTRLLMRSSHQEDAAILAALGAGADGYCLKDSSDTILIEAIETVARGRAWLDARIAGQLREMFDGEKRKSRRSPVFSLKLESAEIQLLTDIADGKITSTPEDLLNLLKEQTEISDDRLRKLMNKLGTASLVQS